MAGTIVKTAGFATRNLARLNKKGEIHGVDLIT
jgi:hypothetical protein